MNKKSLLAQYVKEKRIEMGLTQEEFARKAGVGLHFVRDVEQGKESVRMDKLNRVMVCLKSELVPCDYIVDGMVIEANRQESEADKLKRLTSYAGLLNDEIIDYATKECVPRLQGLANKNLSSVILFGSCARGDYTPESDIDIAVVLKCDRAGCNKYMDGLSWISAYISSKTLAIANFMPIPEQEYLEKRSWYPLYNNIYSEGKVLYEQ